MAHFTESQHYAQCTEQEKRWFTHYFEHRDLKDATYHAFRVNSDASARAYGRSVSTRKHIQALIEEYMTPETPLPTLEDLKRQYIEISLDEKSTQREKLLALNSYERLCGFGKSKDANPDPADAYDPLDDIVG